MELCTTSDELQVFIRSNIQQILIGVTGNLVDEKDSIDYLCAAIDKLLDIINWVSSIFCIPSELESSLRRARHILVDKEDDTMFRKLRRVVEDDLLLLFLKNSWNWVLNMVSPHRKWPNCLEFPAKPFSGGWHEFGLKKKPYSQLYDMTYESIQFNSVTVSYICNLYVARKATKEWSILSIFFWVEGGIEGIVTK